MTSSLRPETNKLYGLGNSSNRWRDLYVGNINSDGDIISNRLLVGSSSINVEEKLNELESNIGGGNGTVISVNGVSPDLNGLLVISSSHISSSFSPTNFSTGSGLGLDRYFSGINEKLQYVKNNILYTTGTQTIIGDKIHSGSLYGFYTIPSNNPDPNLLPNIQWVNEKFGSLTGALLYKGATSYNSNEIKSSSSGDVWAISNSGELLGSDYVFPGNLVIFKEDLSGSITSGSYNIIDINAGIRSINGISTPSTILKTGDISEGTGSNPTNNENLWFTDTRARLAISSSSPYISYNQGTGIINSSLIPFTKNDVKDMFIGNQHSGIIFEYSNNVLSASVTSQGSVTSVNNQTPTSGNVVLKTNNIEENNALYFTVERAQEAFSAGTGITITSGTIATTITQYTDTQAVSASRNELITGSLEGNETNKSPTVKATKDYISSQINSATSFWTSSSITVDPLNEFISYTPNGEGNGTAIISSSLTTNLIQSISRNVISSSDNLISYNSSTGVISSSIASNYIPLSQKALINGVATLGQNGKIPSEQLPALQITNVSSGLDNAKPGVGTAIEGDFFIATDTNKSYVYDGTSWIQITSGINISTVNGKPGPTVSLTTDDISEGSNNKYFTNSLSRNSISTLGSYLSYNQNNGIISSSLTESGIKDLTVLMLSGTDQSRHSGIRFNYANGFLSASVTSQGSVTSVNNQTPTSGNVALSANHISMSSSFNSNYPAGPAWVPSNSYQGLESHFVGINNLFTNIPKLNDSNTFNNSNTFTGAQNTFSNIKLLITGSNGIFEVADNSSVIIPTISTLNDDLLNNAVNKRYLVQYFNYKNSSYLSKDGSTWSTITNPAAARTAIGLGSASTLNTGTVSGNIPVLDASGLPAVGGSALTSLPSITLLNGVNINTPTDKQVLTYDSATSKWINKDASSGAFMKYATGIDAVNDFKTENIVVLKIDCSVANPVLALPATSALNDKKMYIIKKIGTTPHNDLSISGALLEGSPFLLQGNYSSLTIISDHASGLQKWMIV